jgi:hypothetical protein
MGGRARAVTYGTLGAELDGPPGLAISKPTMAGEVEV